MGKATKTQLERPDTAAREGFNDFELFLVTVQVAELREFAPIPNISKLTNI